MLIILSTIELNPNQRYPYIPSTSSSDENKEFDKLFKCVEPIACLMFPPAPDAKNASIKRYRQTCSGLRAVLEVPEVKEVRREVLKRRAGFQRDV